MSKSSLKTCFALNRRVMISLKKQRLYIRDFQLKTVQF